MTCRGRGDTVRSVALSGRVHEKSETRIVFLEAAKVSISCIPSSIEKVAPKGCRDALYDRSRHSGEAGRRIASRGIEYAFGVRPE